MSEDVYQEPLPFVADKVVMIEVEALIEHATNAKEHPPEQIAKLAGGIKEFGFTVPVLVRGRDLVAGHGRLLAAQKLGMPEIPTIDVSHLTDGQVRALILFDNRISETGWNMEALRAEVEHLDQLDPELLGVTGFDPAEIDRIVSDLEDFTGDDDERDSGVEVPSLRFSSHKIEMSQAEEQALCGLVEIHANKYGTTHGFVSKTLLEPHQ